jgi:hypothetical protein
MTFYVGKGNISYEWNWLHLTSSMCVFFQQYLEYNYIGHDVKRFQSIRKAMKKLITHCVSASTQARHVPIKSQSWYAELSQSVCFFSPVSKFSILCKHMYEWYFHVEHRKRYIGLV